MWCDQQSIISAINSQLITLSTGLSLIKHVQQIRRHKIFILKRMSNIDSFGALDNHSYNFKFKMCKQGFKFVMFPNLNQFTDKVAGANRELRAHLI